MNTSQSSGHNPSNGPEKWTRSSLIRAIIKENLTLKEANKRLKEIDPQASPITLDEVRATQDRPEYENSMFDSLLIVPSKSIFDIEDVEDEDDEDDEDDDYEEGISAGEIADPLVYRGKDYVLGEIETREDGSHIGHLRPTDCGKEMLIYDCDGEGYFSYFLNTDEVFIPLHLSEINILNPQDLPEGFSLEDLDGECALRY